MENQLNNKLPNAQVSFILGIVSIFPGCLCNLLGLVLGIVGFVMAKKAIEEYEANPDSYSSEDYQKAQNGKKFSMIGIILCAVLFIVGLILNLTGVMAGLMDQGGGF